MLKIGFLDQQQYCSSDCTVKQIIYFCCHECDLQSILMMLSCWEQCQSSCQWVCQWVCHECHECQFQDWLQSSVFNHNIWNKHLLLWRHQSLKDQLIKWNQVIFLAFFFIFTTKQFFSFENRIFFSPSLENFLSFAEACKYQEFVFSKSSQIPLMTDV